MRGLWTRALIAFAAVLSACTPVASPVAPTAFPLVGGSQYGPVPLDPPVKVTVGVVGSTADGGIFLAQDRGYFQAEGIQLEVQRFKTLVDMVPPLTTGQLQVASGAVAASLFNAAARGLRLQIVADKGHTASPEWDYVALVIRRDLIESGQVRDYKDLKGLRLVTTARGNSTEVVLATALSRGGLTLEDVNFGQLGLPETVAAFKTKAIDGAIVVEPYISRIVSDGTGVRWKDSVEILGRNEQVGVVVYGEQLAANQDVAQRWMTAFLRGTRDYNDAFGPAKKDYNNAVRVLTQDTDVTDPAIYQEMRPAGLDPDGALDMESIQSDLNYYIDSGQVNDRPDLPRLINTSFQQRAVDSLGPYAAR
jgi:NitT/TauT family transport system substrate-binding protein